MLRNPTSLCCYGLGSLVIVANWRFFTALSAALVVRRQVTRLSGQMVSMKLQVKLVGLATVVEFGPLVQCCHCCVTSWPVSSSQALFFVWL